MTDIIFITAIGRSGTMWTARTLNKAHNTVGIHELTGNINKHREDAIGSKEESEEFVEEELKPAVYRKCDQIGEKKLVIVDSYLRNDVEQIKEIGEVVHQVRDPKMCVRGQLESDTVWDGSEWLEITPDEGAHSENWETYSPLQKASWYWCQANKKLHEDIDKTIILERMNDDWDYMKDKLLDPFGIELQEVHWSGMTNRKVNQSMGDYFLPHPDNWTEIMEEQFEEICGDLVNEIYQR